MSHYTVDKVFERVLKREMAVLIAEKSKQCQVGATIDLATDRLVEAYFLKSQYDDMVRSRDFERSCHASEKSERQRYQALLAEERERK